jgi:carbon starvation protein
VNSFWLIVTALAAFAVSYRYYSAFLAAKVASLNDSRATPAHRLKDGVDYHLQTPAPKKAPSLVPEPAQVE